MWSFALTTVYKQSAVKSWLLFTFDEEVGGIEVQALADCFAQKKLPAELATLKCLVEIDTTPSGRIVNPPSSLCWRLSKEKFSEMLADNRIWFVNNQEAKREIKNILGGRKSFNTPNSP